MIHSGRMNGLVFLGTTCLLPQVMIHKAMIASVH